LEKARRVFTSDGNELVSGRHSVKSTKPCVDHDQSMSPWATPSESRSQSSLHPPKPRNSPYLTPLVPLECHLLLLGYSRPSWQIDSVLPSFRPMVMKVSRAHWTGSLVCDLRCHCWCSSNMVKVLGDSGAYDVGGPTSREGDFSASNGVVYLV